MGCLSSSKASVVINGSPMDEFDINKGVQQGDPLSPFLFIVAMEGLKIAMRVAFNEGLFHVVKMGNGDPLISHLFYADDAIFVGEWSQNNLKNLARILRCFHITSRLKVNFHKSKVFGIGVSQYITRD